LAGIRPLNKKYLIIGAVVVAVAVVGISYYFMTASSSAVIVRLVSTNPPVQGGLILPQNEKRHWDPGVIELTVGQTVTFAVVNNDDIETHQFAIPALNVTSDPVRPFESTTFEFTPTKVGNFTFIDPRPLETYNYTDYRSVDVHQIVNHSLENGTVVVHP
jgi:heme/copper-type cytochrome/quinol oxidase subunit 2